MRTCPKCGSTNIARFIDQTPGTKYSCNMCGYAGENFEEKEVTKSF